MKRIHIIGLILLISIVFSNQSFKKIEKLALPQNVKMIEPTHSVENISTGIPNIYESRNNIEIQFIDSSPNGYSFISCATSPLSSHSDNLLLSYRKFIDFNASTGIISSASFKSDLSQIELNEPIESQYLVGRYPSAILTDEAEYIFWNEYTGPYTGVYHLGGTPYYAENNNPVNIFDTDPILDLWNASVTKSNYLGDDIFNLVYDNWNTDAGSGSYLFNIQPSNLNNPISGPVLIGDESYFWNPNGDYEYTSSWLIDINEQGTGYIAAVSYLEDPSSGSPHTMFFRATNDHGNSWSNSFSSDNQSPYYQIPKEILTSLKDEYFADEYFTDDDDDSNDLFLDDLDLFMTYEFDLEVDSQGNPHFIVGLVPYDELLWTGLEGVGYYHFTINKEYLDSPGEPQTEYGWRYSKVASMEDSYTATDQFGSSLFRTFFPSLSISRYDDQIMYVVSPMYVVDENNTFPSNSDIFLMRTSNGRDWTLPENITNTFDIDEVYAHAASNADNTGLNFLFTVPDYNAETVPPAQSYADFLNYIYVGRYTITNDVPGCTDSNACNFNPNATINDGSCDYPSNPNYDCFGYCAVDIDCNGDCGGSAEFDCNGICNGDSLADVCGICDGTETDETQCGCECEDDCQEFFDLGAQSGDINLDGTLNIIDILNLVQLVIDQ